MNRKIWILAGIAVLILALLSVLLGLGLVPSIGQAEEKGTVAGWWLVWTVISIAVLSALALATFLFAAGMGKVPETRS